MLRRASGPARRLRLVAAFAAVGWLALVACDEAPPAANRAPSAPHIEGPGEVVAGQSAQFSVTVFDPDGDRVRLFIAWGDGDTTDYGQFLQSTQTVQVEHVFARADTYRMSGRCHDLEPLFSTWSAPLVVVAVGR
jgi:hypothetical protein